jgi:hypothetical protein
VYILHDKRGSKIKRRKLQEELHHLHSSSNIIKTIKPRKTRWAQQVAHMREDAYTQVSPKPEVKRRGGRARSRREDNIQMNLKETGCEDRTGFI